MTVRSIFRCLPIFFSLFISVSVGTAVDTSCWQNGQVPSRERLVREMEMRAIRYFLVESNPRSGLVRDRAKNFTATPDDYQSASLAATGFGMAVLANGSLRGLVPRDEAAIRITRALRFVEEKLFHHVGWLYHFVDWETGVRSMGSEVSTIDTALFIAGALYAGSAFPNTEIADRANRLFARMDFNDMRTHGKKFPDKMTLSMGWTPESGYLFNQWSTYSEHLLLQLLGLGHPTHGLPPEAWTAWKRQKKDHDVLIGGELPLFTHQYSHLFIDLRRRKDQFADYFQNSILATREHRDLSNEKAPFLTLRKGFWGMSASDSPKGYFPFAPEFSDGTVCPGCAAASAVFLPEMVLGDVTRWVTGPICHRLWGQYGLVDSVNLDSDWFDQDVIGITVGALYLAVADLDVQDPPWRRFSALESVQRGFKMAGLEAYKSEKAP